MKSCIGSKYCNTLPGKIYKHNKICIQCRIVCKSHKRGPTICSILDAIYKIIGTSLSKLKCQIV